MKNTLYLIKNNYKEYIKNSIIYGSYLGFIIFSIFMLLVFIMNIENVVSNQSLAPIFFILSLTIGFFIIFFRNINQDIRYNYNILNGISGIYWIMIITFFIPVLSIITPFIFKLFINSTIVTILSMWFLEYLYLKNTANDLNTFNSSKKYKTIYIELNKKINSVDEFLEELDRYCLQFENVEYISLGIPTKLKIDNVLYEADITEYYSIIGTPIIAISLKTL
ncbi:DUF4318 domain-containing protein [Peptacetobacter sp.]|uniref:DUF4318 domain-containing protein n=1 Tax=Peptacetobacter sp. TaxID=2991975 RepID=UPI0026305420|nr:DUF4318 domain-containing protein [Peptacetobacter sp.]